ncbi:hypothetical protein CRENBAI_007263 [Crenichthys baileyi]|uniref:Uncharacterized protein n=1 Tax=Crenichthys baileyi TaxID=28760 RepID=A0AAV9RG70_9TELE
MVTFVDDEGQSEGAMDDGGPSREFLRLQVAALRDSRYFVGPEGTKNLSLAICPVVSSTNSPGISRGGWRLRTVPAPGQKNLVESQLAVGEASAALCSLGCASSLADMEDRQALIEQAARAHVGGCIKPALNQLIEGLECLKVAEAMRAYPDVLRPIFVSGHSLLTIQSMVTLFETVLSHLAAMPDGVKI